MPWLTIMDRYILWSLLILVLAVVQNGLAGGATDQYPGFNEYSRWGLLGFWFVVQICTLWPCWKTLQARRRACASNGLLANGVNVTKAVAHARDQLDKHTRMVATFTSLNLDVPEVVNRGIVRLGMCPPCVRPCS